MQTRIVNTLPSRGDENVNFIVYTKKQNRARLSTVTTF